MLRSIRPMHPFTYRGPSQASDNVHVIRPTPPCKYVPKAKANAHLISSYPLKLSIATVSSLSFFDPNFRWLGLELASNEAEDVRITHWNSCSCCCSTSSSRCPCLLHAFYPFFSSSQGATLGRRVRLRQWLCLPSRCLFSFSLPHPQMSDFLSLALFQTMSLHRFVAASSVCRYKFPLFGDVRCV